MKHGSRRYRYGFNRLVDDGIFKRCRIPQMEEVCWYLTDLNGWKIKPVSGILSQREFLNALALKHFCCTQYIRHYA
jgi:phenylalanine-4-hydroxylase